MIGTYIERVLDNVERLNDELNSFLSIEREHASTRADELDAAATDLRDMFTPKADLRPYRFQKIQYAKGASKTWIAMTKFLDFTEADAEEVNLRGAIMKSENLPRKKPRKK